MGKLTHKQIIKHYLTDKWVPGFKLRGIDTPFGWLGSQADRRARELAEDGEIERKMIGKYVNYRAKEVPVAFKYTKVINKPVKLTFQTLDGDKVTFKGFRTRLTKMARLF